MASFDMSAHVRRINRQDRIATGVLVGIAAFVMLMLAAIDVYKRQVVDRPVIQHIVEEGLASAADEVVIVNSREKKSIEEHFSPNPELVSMLRERGKDKYADAVEHAGNLNVSYVYQDEPLGLGHAVHLSLIHI